MGPGQTSWQAFNRNVRREMLAQWRRDEVLRRDQRQCMFVHPNGKRCKNRRWLQVHHIVEKSLGGGDHVDNLITLCVNHHRLIHWQTGWEEDPKSKRLTLGQKFKQNEIHW